MNGDPPPPPPPPAGSDASVAHDEASVASAASATPAALVDSEAGLPSVAPGSVESAERFGSVPPSSSLRPSEAPHGRPTFLFLGVVAAISLVADVTSKAWAEIV